MPKDGVACELALSRNERWHDAVRCCKLRTTFQRVVGLGSHLATVSTCCLWKANAFHRKRMLLSGNMFSWGSGVLFLGCSVGLGETLLLLWKATCVLPAITCLYWAAIAFFRQTHACFRQAFVARGSQFVLQANAASGKEHQATC